MATASKRLTRKEIREPDKFLILTTETLEFVRRKRALVIGAVAVLLAVLIGIWAWSTYKAHQDSLAVKDFGHALEHYHAGRYKEAVSALGKVQDYRWSRYAGLAYLYEASSHLAMNDLDRALPAAQRFIAATSSDSLYRQMGLTTLADIESLKGLRREAIQHYIEAEKIAGPFKERALLGKARNYAQLGDARAAIAAYRQYLGENPASPLASQVTSEIAQLETKVAAQPATK